jgi:hypothetical protein
MSTITQKRILKMPLLALAALAAGLIALVVAGQPRPAAADTPCAAGCTVQVEFQSIRFPKLSDCAWPEVCDPYEQSVQAYGSFAASTWKAGSFGPIKKLKLASWGSQPGFCPSFGVEWSDSNVGKAECFRTADQMYGDLSPAFSLAETFLCSASSNVLCNGAWKKNNNRVTLTVKPGEMLMLSAVIYDYDAASANDLVCNPGTHLGPFTAQQLAGLNSSTFMSSAFNGDGSCEVFMSVKRVN